MNTIKTMDSRFGRHGLLALMLLASVWPARATPAPPPKAPQLREASMAVTVRLIEAKNGQVFRVAKLCEVRGKIPVYADDGSPLSFPPAEILGCTMPWKQKNLAVSVWGAKAISKDSIAFATAGVSATPPGAAPGCPHPLCGPQPLADSRAEIRVSGAPKMMKFGLSPSPVSMLGAKSAVWFEAEVEMID